MKLLVIASMLVATPALSQTQADMNSSAGSAYTRADAAMTREWRATYAYMKGRDAQNTSRGGGFGYAAAALESQRAWLKFRDTQCVVEGGEFAGGSIQGMTMAGCRTRLTNDRSAQLRKLRWAR